MPCDTLTPFPDCLQVQAEPRQPGGLEPRGHGVRLDAARGGDNTTRGGAILCTAAQCREAGVHRPCGGGSLCRLLGETLIRPTSHRRGCVGSVVRGSSSRSALTALIPGGWRARRLMGAACEWVGRRMRSADAAASRWRSCGSTHCWGCCHPMMAVRSCTCTRASLRPAATRYRDASRRCRRRASWGWERTTLTVAGAVTGAQDITPTTENKESEYKPR